MVPEYSANVPVETCGGVIDAGDERRERKERVFSNVFGEDEGDVSGAVKVIGESLLSISYGLRSILGRDFGEL